MDNFSDGVKLLLDRMEQFPEEFMYDEEDRCWPDKWGELICDLRDRADCDRLNEDYEDRNVSYMVRGLTKEEHVALWGKICEIERNKFEVYVLQRLTETKKRRK